jgi:hypothetical protein
MLTVKRFNVFGPDSSFSRIVCEGMPNECWRKSAMIQLLQLARVIYWCTSWYAERRRLLTRCRRIRETVNPLHHSNNKRSGWHDAVGFSTPHASSSTVIDEDMNATEPMLISAISKPERTIDHANWPTTPVTHWWIRPNPWPMWPMTRDTLRTSLRKHVPFDCLPNRNRTRWKDESLHNSFRCMRNHVQDIVGIG